MSFIPPGECVNLLALDSHSVLCVTRGGSVFIKAGSVFREVTDDTHIFLLPLLERRYESVVQELKLKEAELGLPLAHLMAQINLSELPFSAFAMRSDYWLGLALGWISQMGTSAYRELLSGVVEAKWVSQRNRQKAFKLLSGKYSA